MRSVPRQLLRRFCVLALTGMILAASAGGIACGDCHEGEASSAEMAAAICACVCHNPTIAPGAKLTPAEPSLPREFVALDTSNPVLDAEPFGVFRPPRHLA
jgi:hypothetical protein